jgi:hypothetical protein
MRLGLPRRITTAAADGTLVVDGRGTVVAGTVTGRRVVAGCGVVVTVVVGASVVVVVTIVDVDEVDVDEDDVGGAACSSGEPTINAVPAAPTTTAANTAHHFVRVRRVMAPAWGRVAPSPRAFRPRWARSFERA